MTGAFYIRNYKGRKSSSVLYELDSNVKFFLSFDKDKVLYAKNPHYGWQMCTVEQSKTLPPRKVE